MCGCPSHIWARKNHVINCTPGTRREAKRGTHEYLYIYICFLIFFSEVLPGALTPLTLDNVRDVDYHIRTGQFYDGMRPDMSMLFEKSTVVYAGKGFFSLNVRTTYWACYIPNLYRLIHTLLSVFT